MHIAPKHRFDQLDRGLSRLLHTELHWLDVPVASGIQAERRDVQLPARPGSTVPNRFLPSFHVAG